MNISPLCILHTLVPQMIPLPTLTLVCMWYKQSNPKGMTPHSKTNRSHFQEQQGPMIPQQVRVQS